MESGVDRSQGWVGSSRDPDPTTAVAATPWRPRQLAFRTYVPSRKPSLAEEASGSGSAVGSASFHKTSALRVIVKKSVLVKLTKDIIETYQICNPDFKRSEAFKRFLTSPHVAASNKGRDNVNSDLILSVNHVLVNESSQRRYIVKELLGQGTFGQVVKCLVADSNSYVAVKVIKNLAAYYNQALYEVNILRTLNQKDPDDKHHIVRMLEYFVCENHLCISFEVLGSNLYELLKMNQLKGISLGLVQMFSKQILVALVATKDAGIIHCDLKPENILLSTSIKPPRVKVIDFGSACKEGQTVYSYIQSRYYRSPEVLLGYPYTTAVDMWSFGCIVAELFLGLPLFPGASEYDLLRRMLKIIGGQPPDNLLRNAKNTSKYFKHIGSIHHLDYNDLSSSRPSAYKLLTEFEIELREQKKPAIGKWYFSSVKLEDIITEYPYKKNLSEEEIHKERNTRLALVDFVRGLVEFDPEKRWTPIQASSHPFVTGEPFIQPYNPPRSTPCIAVSRNIMVDHDPGRGHFVATGLSPQVSDLNRSIRHNSPHFPMVAFPQGGNYGSVGSYGSFGSFGEQSCFRGSYGSYGDHSSMHAYYSPAGPSGLGIPMHVGRSSIASSPDTRNVSHYPYGPGIGISPSGSFGPMSLGVSPSQFTPPGSQMPVLGSSPGKYGPTSPVRAGSYGSPLGKAAAMGQYNKRRHSGLSGTFPVQPLESTSQQWPGHHPDLSNYSDGGSVGHISSPRSLNVVYGTDCSNQRDLGSLYQGSSLAFHQTQPSHAGNFDLLHSPDVDLSESSSFPLNPGDWDPNYSDELLLQESSVVSTIASGMNNLHLGFSVETVGPTAFDLNAGSDKGQEMRLEGINHRSSNARSSSSAVQNIYIGNSYTNSGPQVRPHFWQASSSHYPLHHSMHFLPTPVCGERVLTNGPFRPNYPVADSHSLTSNAFGSKTWGQRAVHPIVGTVPSTHARDEYGRIV